MKKLIIIALLLLLPILGFAQEGGINRGLISGPNFIPSLVGTTTWGSGSAFTWTFDAGTTDPTFTFGSGSVLFKDAVFTFPNVGLTAYDTNASHYLMFKPGSDLSANKTLTFTTGDSDRTLTIGADSSISGTAYVSGGTDVAIADGGTGQGTAQLAINALTAVAGATNEHVLTKDTATGNAIFKVGGGGTTLNISDYQFIPIDAGIDSVLGAPNAAIKVQGVVGATIPPTPLNVSYSTFTINADGINIDAATWGSGTQTATFSCTGLTIGSLYLFQFTPTVANQVPTFTATSGSASAVIPTIVTAVVENIYFRATATTAVFTATNTGASTWSTTSTTVKAYSRPAVVREFLDTANTNLVFKWKIPDDISGTTITYYPVMVVSQSTAPTTGQTIIFNLAGAAFGDSGSLSGAVGTFVASTYTAPADLVQYDKAVSSYSGAVTITGLAANKMVDLILYRDVADTYGQAIGLEGITIKYSRTLAP